MSDSFAAANNKGGKTHFACAGKVLQPPRMGHPPAVLRRVDVLTILHEHKYTYVPDCVLEGIREA